MRWAQYLINLHYNFMPRRRVTLSLTPASPRMISMQCLVPDACSQPKLQSISAFVHVISTALLLVAVRSFSIASMRWRPLTQDFARLHSSLTGNLVGHG